MSRLPCTATIVPGNVGTADWNSRVASATADQEVRYFVNPTLEQAFQLVAALVILLAFAGWQIGLVSQRSRGYLGINLAGSATLAASALHDQQWGFLLLEGVWAVISAIGLTTGTIERRREPGPVRQQIDR